MTFTDNSIREIAPVSTFFLSLHLVYYFVCVCVCAAAAVCWRKRRVSAGVPAQVPYLWAGLCRMLPG